MLFEGMLCLRIASGRPLSTCRLSCLGCAAADAALCTSVCVAVSCFCGGAGVVLPLFISVCSWVEEIGWRGYLQPILDKRFGPVIATLINCAIWTVWHLPLCFIKGTYQYSGSYLWFVVSLIGSAFSLAAINKVHGSIMPCILFHAAGNAIVSYGISVSEGIGMAVSTCIQVLVSIGVFIVYRKNKASLFMTDKT